MAVLDKSSDAWNGLHKLLLKLGILTDSAENIGPNKSLWGPIACLSQAGKLNEHETIARLSQHLKTPAVSKADLENKDLWQNITIHIEASLPFETWQQHRILPLESGKSFIRVAVFNPMDHQTIKSIEFAAGRPIRPEIAPESWIVETLERIRSAKRADSLAQLMGEKGSEPSVESKKGNQETSLDIDNPEAAPVVQLVNKILLDSISARASDIHLSPGKAEFCARIRVDGIMQDLISIPSDMHRSIVSRIKLLAGMNIAEHRRPQDGRLRIIYDSVQKDLRVSTVPTLHGENVVIRVLESELAHVSLEGLGMPAQVLSNYKEALSGTSRMVLVTGPTGSGKTSTLYASLLLLHDGKRHIITVEDPIEYCISGVDQIQINTKADLSFSAALRSILRQDPDVVVVGEIRDAATAEIAMQAAQTGHIVLSTLHTNSAPAAITRLADLGIAPYLMASSLHAVVAQRLVRKLCTACADAPTSQTTARLNSLNVASQNARDARGCEKCGGSGYSGRIGIYSLLTIDDQVRETIRHSQAEAAIEEVARNSGSYLSLNESALQLIEQGITSLDEVERVLGRISKPLEGPGKAQKQSVAYTEFKNSGNFVRPKVMVIEDDDNMRSILGTLLEVEMFEVIEASNGKKAIELLCAERPDLILCDVMMPIMDGIQTVSIIRRDPNLNGIPILMLTAAANEENEVRLLECGADDFLSKTADRKVLVARINRLISRVVHLN